MGAPVTPKLIDGMVSLMRKQAAWRSDLGLTIEPEPTAHTEYKLRHIFGWTEQNIKDLRKRLARRPGRPRGVCSGQADKPAGIHG
jgi:hypothetical protein